MFTESSTFGETIDTTKILESNDIWIHFIPVSGTARITVKIEVVEGKDVDITPFSEDAFDKYVREPLNKLERVDAYPKDNLGKKDIIDAQYDLANALIEASFQSNNIKNQATKVYSNSYSAIVDGDYNILIWNNDFVSDISHPSKVHLTIKYEPLLPINTEGNNIDETRTIEQKLYWAHSFIGGTNESVKISVIEGGDINFLLMDEVGFKMYTDKESNRIVYKEHYTKFSSIAYDFIGNRNEKYYIVIDNTGRIANGTYSKSPIKVHLEVQEQTQETLPIKATSGFEVIFAMGGLIAVVYLRRR